ncbi:transcription antitermination factor NusB [Clostridium manihotivorum]|uniref:Transcription antitermination protein NusB n=1 Tax=Clostridium manihotivorum TaxID=2320868 RepID=A0A410DSQ5_9CLOT|nr:transcription antitermination factor NusB [Clostridium manihotivorum]QAA32067.1 transcription antitermination factor NusB [Clostridium manihotivorum]
MNRIKTREIAVQLTYQMMINKEEPIEAIESYKEAHTDDINDLDATYLEQVLKGIEDTKEELDKIVERYLVNWKLNRVSKVNLAILRVAIYEMVHLEDIPNKVAINEALEVAKKFSDEKSVAFINGVLDKALKEI